MPEWTQEPWQVHVDEDNGEVVVGIPTGSKGREWCSYYLIAEMSWYDAEDRKRVLANAYRIQACVNSCQSLPDPSVVPELVDENERLKAEIERLGNMPVTRNAKDDRIATLEATRAQDCASIEELEAETEQLRAEKDLHVHQVLTCGIVARGKEHLNEFYQPGGEWDTAQAGMVRDIRAELTTLRAESKLLTKAKGVDRG